jgi:hypothetical protein
MPATFRDEKAVEKQELNNSNVTENKVVNTSKKVIY